MVEMLRVEASSLAHKVEGLEEECEERSSQANTWYEALKVSRVHAYVLVAYEPCARANASWPVWSISCGVS